MTTLALPRSRRRGAADSAQKLIRTRRARAAILMECLEPRTLMTAALVQSFNAVPVLNDIITPQNTDLSVSQFNPATGVLLGARVASATDAIVKIDATILNTEAGQPVVNGSYSGFSVSTLTLVPGSASFPGTELTSSVTQPTVPFTVNNGPGTKTDGTDGKLIIHVDLSDPHTSSFFMTAAQANAAGYVGVGNLTSGHANAQGQATLVEVGGGNETVSKSNLAHVTAVQTASYYYIVQGSVAGVKFNDLSNLGVKDAGEPGLTGWTMTLTGTEDQITDPADVSHILYAGGAIVPIIHTTGAGGAYSFTSLNPGSYTITETGQPGWTETFPAAGATYAVTVAANGTVTIHPSNLPQTTVQSADFGNHFPKFEIKGFKYNDVLGNDNAGGTVGSSDDVLLNGVVIQLWQEDNATVGLQPGAGNPGDSNGFDHLVATQTTGQGGNANGAFDFTNLNPAKSYYVIEIVPVGSQQTAGATVANPIVIPGTPDGVSSGNNFANFTPPNTGSTATIGFWQNKNGTAVIATGGIALVNWLKTNFPNLYGGATGTSVTLSTASNAAASASVSALFTSGQNSYFGSHGTKTNAQVLNIALAIYFSDVNNNSTAQKFGFGSGTGDISVNVGNNAAAFSYPGNVLVNGDHTSLFQLLKGVDFHTVNGVIWPGNHTNWLAVNNVLDFVANAFDI